MPYDSGQSGTARPEPVDVTIAPAKMRNSVDAATNLVKRRSHTGVGAEPPNRIAASSLRLLSGDVVIGGNFIPHVCVGPPPGCASAGVAGAAAGTGFGSGVAGFCGACAASHFSKSAFDCTSSWPRMR